MAAKNAFQQMQNPILMATIGGAQGLRGEVRVNARTGDPMDLGSYGNLVAEDGRVLEILDLRQHKNVVVVRFRGVNDRNAAESLNGLNLYIDRDNLSEEDLEEDEYYYADLEGLEALDADGQSYGTVSAIFDFGAGDILELSKPGQRSVLIPFSEASVLEIDMDGGTILIDPIAAGLVDDEDEDNGKEDGDPQGDGKA